MKMKIYAGIILWLLIVAVAGGKDFADKKEAHRNLAFHTAQAFFNQIVITRSWNASHGGVYVPINEENQPNPYLDDPLRDLETPQGISLTKINPAFMTRQIAEIAARRKGVQFHITSLKPLRPENRPAGWEKKWLQSFERGVKEQGEFVSQDKGTSFRYMAPVITESSCLKCHAVQGYKQGDIRGGISVILPFFPQIGYWPLLIGYGLTALLGSLLIYINGYMIYKRDRRQQSLIEELRHALAEIRTLRGIIPICCHCKKIRDDTGYWNQVEGYISEHSDARLSHGICPDCIKELYPETLEDAEDR